MATADSGKVLLNFPMGELRDLSNSDVLKAIREEAELRAEKSVARVLRAREVARRARS